MSGIVTIDQARAVVLAEVRPCLAVETADLGDCRGRRLAADLEAEAPWPSTDRSAMDGFALATGPSGASVGQSFRVVGEALAGHPCTVELQAGEAARVMTGAVVPAGATTVVKVEDSSGYEHSPMTVQVAVPAGANIRYQGSEIAVGDRILAAGVRIRAAEIGALATLGQSRVAVFRQPRVAVIATGDEVVPVENTPASHQLRDSNSHAIAAQVAECGGRAERLGIIADTVTELGAAFTRAFEIADIVVSIGGVSKGTHDLVHPTLRDLGVEERFHGVAIKPGKPTFFGVFDGDRRRYVFGLPGNPASCSTVFDLLVAPLLRRLGGGTDAACLAVRVSGAPFRPNWRTQAIPARLVSSAADGLEADLLAARPSGDPVSLAGGDGYVLVPAETDTGTLQVGEWVPYCDQR